MARIIRDPKEIVHKLGGASAVARLFGIRPSAVLNWLTRGYLPPATYVPLRDALKKQGLKADESLWSWHETP